VEMPRKLFSSREALHHLALFQNVYIKKGTSLPAQLLSQSSNKPHTPILNSSQYLKGKPTITPIQLNLISSSTSTSIPNFHTQCLSSTTATTARKRFPAVAALSVTFKQKLTQNGFLREWLERTATPAALRPKELDDITGLKRPPVTESL